MGIKPDTQISSYSCVLAPKFLPLIPSIPSQLIMSLEEILQHRRAIRYYDPQQPISADRVQQCLELATLAPTSSNMQLWRAYHITDPAMVQKLAPACLGQSTVSTAQQLVVFTIEPSLYKERCQQNIDFQRDNIQRNFPANKQEKYFALQQAYYTKVVPFLYSRFFGIWGGIRKALAAVGGLFRPVPRQLSEGEMNTVLHKSCALVAQTLMLAMSEAGYDTCPIEGFDGHRVKHILGLKGSSEVSLIVSCGIREASRPLGDRFRVDFASQYQRIGD